MVRRWIIRCRSSLTSCRFCNFTSLFTSKKHFPYLILGFVLTALLTTVFSNIQLLGSSVASVVKDFSGTFNALPMLAIALIGFAFAAISYKMDKHVQQLIPHKTSSIRKERLKTMKSNVKLTKKTSNKSIGAAYLVSN